MKRKSGHRRHTKVVGRSRKNLRRTVKRKSVGKGRRRPTRRYSRVQRGGDTLTDNLNCFVTVGDIYHYGYSSLERDDAMSFKLYEVAAYNGNADGQYRMGETYRRAWGVERDDTKAIEYYKLAAAQGHKNALQKLKDMTPPQSIQPPND